MSSNDRIILGQILEQRKDEVAPDLSEPDYFEVFTAEQILKDFEPSYDEVESGIVGGGNDGGIDSLYLFVNGVLILEDTDLSIFKKDLIIDLTFIQSKTSPSFSEATMDKFYASTSNLLDLSKSLDDLSSTYNADLIEKVGLFRKTHRGLANRFPKLRFSYFYATKGDSPSENVKRKAEPLDARVKELFSGSIVHVEFLGASELLQLAQRTPQTTYQLALSDNPISAGAQGVFLAIVNLRNYFEFITDDEGRLRRHVFDANVRDYQGTVQVNKGIQETLRDSGAIEDFWWLNNGITIVASQATHSGRVLNIENPLIVNGLQTSTEIYEYFDESNPDSEDRNLLVRVITPLGDDSRDKIIKATNSQTSIPPASLRATEQIHRNIEQYLSRYDIYYDRRKNFYKNEGKPREKIIGIPKLAQSVMSIVLRRPHDARARPSTLINNDADYGAIFSDSYHIDIYRICAVILQKVEVIIKSDAADLEQRYRNNLKFYLAMYAALIACGESSPGFSSIQNIDVEEIDDTALLKCLAAVKSRFESDGAIDQTAKSSEFTEHLLADIEGELAS